MDLGDRVSLLLNRAQRRMLISSAHIQELLGMPVHMEFPNDYQGVHESLAAGRAVDPGSDFGRQATRLAHDMLGKAIPAPAGAAKKKRLNLFPVPSTQYSLSTGKE